MALLLLLAAVVGEPDGRMESAVAEGKERGSERGARRWFFMTVPEASSEERDRQSE